METRDRIRHDRSRYERPTLGWRCGRGAMWGKPCRRGPTAFGTCGGTAACAPQKGGDTWQCRRPPIEGGPCEPGPDGNGRCGLSQPPCAPRPTLYVWRKRAAIVAAALSIAIIALLLGTEHFPTVTASSVDPGPLSAGHAHFVGQDNCGACHQGHDAGAVEWWQLTVSGMTDGAAPRVAEACSECHGFNGMDRQAHNQSFPEHADVGPTNCLMCHSEHKGGNLLGTTISDAQCQTCHEERIDDFATEHPPFPPGFPHEQAKNILFDHGTHFGRHFEDPQLADLVPEGGCVGCHEVETAARQIQPAGFDVTCAGCHESSITGREFVLFRWPELLEQDIPVDDIVDACGLSEDVAGDVADLLDESQFMGVSLEYPTSMQALLTDTPEDDPDAFGPAVQELAENAIYDGADPLIDLADERFGEGAGERLFAGLNDEQMRQAFCAWASNREYEPTGSGILSGWKADFLDIRYVSPSHADPVLKAWIDAVAGLPEPEDADAADRLAFARDQLLAEDGPGRCMKCHASFDADDGALNVTWNTDLGDARALTRFEHDPHINLLGPEKSCTNCHALNPDADGSGSAFQAVSVSGCSECHAAGKLRDDCLMCHVYHQDHALKKGMMADVQ